ncbi:MAG: 50S ribosomal protein L4 [Chloroflexota bacterium]
MEVPVYNLSGEVVKNIDISDDVFAVPFNEAVVHQAMVRQQANERQGTASAKTRSEVSGSTRKLFRQKHTGNARAGSIKSPLRRGGGIVFAPKPRDYRQAMPKKMRRLALRCLLSAKARDGDLKVLESLALETSKTRDILGILSTLGVGTSAIIATSGVEENLVKSARNIPGIKTMPVHILNTLDMLKYRELLITEEALRRTEQLWGQRRAGGNDAHV